MKKLILISLAVLMMLGLTACGSNEPTDTTSEGPVTVSLWHTYSDHHNEFLNNMINEFNESQNEVFVEVIQKPSQDFDAALIQALRNGQGPDICGRFATNIADYLVDDLIVDFKPYIDGENGIPNFEENLIGRLYDEMSQWGTDAIYAIPVINTSEVFYYNKTLFDSLGLEVPTTWAELEEVARTIKNETGYPGFGTDANIDTFQGLLMQNGSGYINAETKSMDVNEEVALEQLQWYADCLAEGIFREPGDDYYLSGPFTSQVVGSYIGSSAGIGFATPAEGTFELGVAPIPQANVDTNPYVSSWGGGYVCFKSTPEKEEAAFKFLKWFAEAEQCSRWAVQFGAMPAFEDAIETEVFQNYLNENLAVKALYDQKDSVNWLNSIPGSAAVRNHISKLLADVSLNGVDAKTAYDAFIAACNADLNQ